MGKKRKIVCFFSVILAIAMVEINTPVTEVRAASAAMTWPQYLGVTEVSDSGYSYRDTDNGAITVEAGQKNFYIGDFVYLTGSFQNMSNLTSGVTYSSSNRKIATVTRNTGRVNTIKPGTAVIIIRYKGEKTSCTLTVTKKGKLGSQKSTYQSLKNVGDKLSASYANKVTSKNCYQVGNQLYLLENQIQNKSGKVNGKGFLYQTKAGKKTISNQLVVPSVARFTTVTEALNQYITSINPIGTNAKTAFSIKSVSGKGSSITIQLKKKVSAAQIYGIQKSVGFDTELTSSKQAEFPVYVKDTKTGHRYYAIATAVQGSSKLQVQIKYHSMVSKRTYMLIGIQCKSGKMAYGWTLGKKFKAK